MVHIKPTQLPETFQHSFYCGTKACIQSQTILESSVCSKEVTARSMLMPTAHPWPTMCFLRGLQEWKSLGSKSRLQRWWSMNSIPAMAP